MPPAHQPDRWRREDDIEPAGTGPSFNAQAVGVVKGRGLAGRSPQRACALPRTSMPGCFPRLLPMTEQAERTTGARVALTPADGDCHSRKNPQGARRRRSPGIDAGLKEEASGRRVSQRPVHIWGSRRQPYAAAGTKTDSSVLHAGRHGSGKAVPDCPGRLSALSGSRRMRHRSHPWARLGDRGP